MFLSFFSFSTQAACPDYDIELEYISGPSSCGYSLYRVKVNSSSSLNVGGINLTLNFTKGGVNSVFFDDASVFSEVSGVSATIGANSIQFQGIPSSSINYDVIGSIGKLAICGRLPGGTTVNLTGQVRNVFSEQCDPQNVILPTINFSDVVEYGGIVQKEPKNCLNSNNGIELVSVSMHEYLNEDQPTVIGTNIQGYYTLNSGTPFVSLKGQCYEICPTKGSVSSCSINANDLARTQGVVLGSYCTTDAWEKLAMDVNNDNYVSTNDLLIMQSIILGTFDFNTSFWKYWKFVEGLAYASMTVNCTAAVPAYSECISVTSNNSTESNGWIGVISGDADGSCTTCSFEGGNDTRDSRQSQINIEETEDNVIFKIYSSEENDPMGQGGEFKFDESQLRNLKVVQGGNEKNESLKYVLENDVFKFHWLNLGSTERDHAKPLITIVADKLTDDLDFASIFAQEESTLNVAHFNNEALPLQYVMNSKFMTMDQSSILISDNGVFLENCQGPKVELSLFTINGKLATSDNNVICGQWWKPDVAPGFYLGKAEDGKNCIAFKILVR